MPRKQPGLASRDVRLRREGTGVPAALAGDADDEQLARLLIRMWSLASGRTVRTDVPPHLLTEDELIAFWADDFSRSRGRHAALGPLDRADAPHAGSRPERARRQPRAATSAAGCPPATPARRAGARLASGQAQ